jgi:hypothetical protein
MGRMDLGDPKSWQLFVTYNLSSSISLCVSLIYRKDKNKNEIVFYLSMQQQCLSSSLWCASLKGFCLLPVGFIISTLSYRSTLYHQPIVLTYILSFVYSLNPLVRLFLLADPEALINVVFTKVKQ